MSIEVGGVDDVFPEFEMEGIQERVGEVWDLRYSLALPGPEVRVCPVCGAEGAIPRRWSFHRSASGSSLRYRCDVGMKCTRCGHFWGHGLVVPQEDFEVHGPTTVRRREALEALRREGWEG